MVFLDSKRKNISYLDLCYLICDNASSYQKKDGAIIKWYMHCCIIVFYFYFYFYTSYGLLWIQIIRKRRLFINFGKKY